MSWMLSVWAAALLALCKGQNTVHEGSSLSALGYHLCIHNETRWVSFLVMHKVPYTVSKPCGGWLLWKTCNATLYKMVPKTENRTVIMQVTKCCNGYVQAGRYCAIPVSRSGGLAAKPGSCPTVDGLHPGSEECEWDMDCPGWQKCCQGPDESSCSHPARSANYSNNRGNRFNATVTVKVDYQQLMSLQEGLLNHTRVLRAMVSGALQFDDVLVHYLSSWPVHPYRTATSLLIDLNETLSLDDVTSKLHLLLKHIQEVSSVTVEDVDECVEPVLHQCSPQADCTNTVGSFQCTCRQGYRDVDPSNPGFICTIEDEVLTTTEIPTTFDPPMNTTFIPVSNTTVEATDTSVTGFFNWSEISTTTLLTDTNYVSYNSSHSLLWTTTDSYSSTEIPPLTTVCSPPSITSLMSCNITGISFSVYWSSQSRSNQTYEVILSKGSEVIDSWVIDQTIKTLLGLNPGVVYSVTVIPRACERQGAASQILVRTDAQTLDATVRLTNIEFTTDLQNSSSEAYRNLTEGIVAEFYQSLSPEMKALVDSGEVRIEITSISQGSVVVNLTFIVVRPSSSHDISDVSVALINSLTNSSRYTVDRNRTNIRDFDECTSDDNDCSQWANCTNTWGSYSCVCKDGFTDNNPDRPGRDCRAALEPMTSSASPAVSLTSGSMTSSTSTSPTSSALIATGPITATEPVTAAITTTVPIPTPVTADTSTMALDITTPTTTTIPSMTTSTTGNTITQTTTVSAPTTTTSPLTTTDLTTTIIPFTTATTVGNTITPTITVSAPTTTPPSLTTPNPTAATTPSTTVTTPSVTAAPTTTTVPVTSITSPSTPATTTISPAPVPTTTAALGNIFMSGAISVQCSVADITVTVARDFLHQANIRENALYLGLVECGVKGANATHVRLTVAWDECSTMLMQNETYYTASVTLFNSMASFTSSSGTVEVPRIRLEVPVVCTYLRSQLISANFNSMGYDLIQDIIMGLGSFHVMVQLMNGTVPLPYNYTMSRDEAVVVQVRLNTSSEQIKVVINRCWATPIPNPAASYSNTFLENSCPMNMYTTVLVNGNSTTSRVSVQIFSFINLDVVYLHCQVHICLQVGSDSCVPDCQSRTSRSAKTIGSDICSGGPLNRLFHFDTEQELDPAYIAGFACLGVGLSLILLGALVCIFYYQRNRIGHYNFAAKPKQENFTYLVFNA
ncbi:uromodulin-like 1 isoform X2 [Cynoglossus semilaevis]|uniref:uromodulin-like 1 isoform X2 n=1 Tax=Cynoglossus semilaevis TaxID=244447 RepID=UPI0007DC91AB|nr:uromodulin-like 1 isoform X2 [Cynoglossus semilaevis]